MESKVTLEHLWLEVSNVALSQNGTVIEVQLKGDLENDRWLKLKPEESHKDLYKAVVEAMKDKRPIHAKLAANGGNLVIEDLRVMFTANTRT